jgi:hypothetical protein
VYYDLNKLSVLANNYGDHLVLNVPLQTANHNFTFFKIITLLLKLTSDKLVDYSLHYAYFGIQQDRQSYLLLSEASYSHCHKCDIVICPTEVAVYDARTNACESKFLIEIEQDNKNI